MTRPRADTNLSEYYDDVSIKFTDTDSEAGNSTYRRDPRVTQIYFCATMWHETKKEMLLMMKSVLRCVGMSVYT